jgi:cytoskeletal protein RodZ
VTKIDSIPLGTRRTARKPIAIAGAAVVAAAGLLLFGPLQLASARHGTASTVQPLVEAASCRSADSSADQSTDSESAHSASAVESGSHSMPHTGSDASDREQSVSVMVPSVAVVRMDKSGTMMSAMTNTGCAPRMGDQLFSVQADGSLKTMSSTMLVTQQWVGDFTQPGVYVAQHH